MRSEKVEIKKLGINGEGIGYINKKICFVNNALPGETVEVEIVEDNRKYLKGKVTKILVKSSDRMHADCDQYSQCLGCSLLHFNYGQQLSYKKQMIRDAFAKYSEADAFKLPIYDIVPSLLDKGYRSVVSLPIAYFKGKVHAGIYQRESKYLTLMDHCPMHDDLINKTLVKIEDILNAHKVRDYNDKVKKGLRFIRLKNIDGAIFVLLVTGEDGISEDVTKEIANIEEVKSIHFTINTTRYQDFDMQGFKKIYGVSTLPYECLGKKYVFSAKSEYPTYPKMEEKKIEILKSMIKENAHVLSINCGVGLLENAIDNDVVGVDSKKEHIKDASDNAHFLRKENAKFVCKNIDEAVVSLCKKNHFDVAVLRCEGLSDAIKQSMILSRVNEILYVTSHASALAKDYEDLKKYYHLESITPLDMYPHQSKLEMIARFVKN